MGGKSVFRRRLILWRRVLTSLSVMPNTSLLQEASWKDQLLAEQQEATRLQAEIEQLRATSRSFETQLNSGNQFSLINVRSSPCVIRSPTVLGIKGY